MKTSSAILILLFISFSGYSQTPETKFLQNKQYRWAAYISDTVNFKLLNLSLAIRQQVDAGKTIAAAQNIDNHIYNEQKADLAMLRSGGVVREKNITEPNDLLSPEYDILFVEQFLYIDKNKVRSQVSWVSPVKKITTTQGVYLGNSYIFNAYHNTSQKINRRTRRGAIRLGITSKIISDSSLKGEMIKQWFRENFSKALWPSLKSGDAEIYRVDNDKKIAVSDIWENFIHSREFLICIDSICPKPYSNSKETEPVNPSDFTQFSLVQDWYYNPKKGIVFNDIREIILYATKNDEADLNPSPILRIIY